MTQKEKLMPFAESATLFSRCRESGPHPGEPEVPGPAEYGPCLQILKTMNRIMAEHFGVPPGPEKERTRGLVIDRPGRDGETRGQNLSPSPSHPLPASAFQAGGPGSQAAEGSRRHE
jgi:hypothetical protein